MDCLVPNCKCSCHRSYSQEINIKELMLQQIDAAKSSGSLLNIESTKSSGNPMMLFTDEEETNNETEMATWGNQDDLWARRRRLHSGEEKPLSHDEYKDHFPKLDDLKKQFGNLDFDNVDGGESENIRELQKTRRDELAAPETRKIRNNNVNPMPQPVESPFPKAVVLNPLHRYKREERDNIIREIYSKALANVKSKHSTLDPSSKQFTEYVNNEADRQLELWMVANK